jgi:hypothetical protein
MKAGYLMLLCCAAMGVLRAQQPTSQPPIPIRALAPPSATSKETVGSVMGLKHLPDGRVLVNDYARRRLVVFDNTLSSYSVVADSSGTGAKAYPRQAARLFVPYLADTTLFADVGTAVFLVIGPDGSIARTMAPVRPFDLLAMSMFGAGVTGTDAQGRWLFRAPFEYGPPRPAGAPPLPPATIDTVWIARANFEARTIDSVGFVLLPSPPRTTGPTPSNPKAPSTTFVNPVPGALDDWAVLSDGSLAIVRGHDYHIDWLYADGTRASTPKMPFDWRRLTDEDKQARIDSARRIVDSITASGGHYASTVRVTLGGADGRTVRDTVYPEVRFVPLKDIADYVPPIRSGALKPDLDGNLWILPTTTARAKGGLLYDVINRKGEIFERVQLPAGRDIVGFGRGGIVYLSKLDGTNGYYIERTTVVHGAPIGR